MARAFRVEGYEIDPASNRIQSGEESHAVEPRVMDVLCFLAAHPGQVMPRQAIIDAVWGVAYGGDESLTRAISLLRKVLRPQAGAAEIIRTVPKRGYSLNGAIGSMAEGTAVAPGERDQPGKRRRRLAVWGAAGLAIMAVVVGGVLWWARQPPPVSHVDGIVVLVKPFVTDADPAAATVLTGELAAALARFDQIKVRRFGEGPPPDTKRAYVYVVTGTVSAAAGTGTQVGVQLHDFASGDTVWSGAEAIAAATDHGGAVSTLSAELEPAAMQAAKKRVQAKAVTSLSPWELILLGTWVPGADQEWPGPPNAQSYWVWERAIAMQPDYAMAHASLAQVMANFALFDPPSDTPAQARRAEQSAEHALQLAPYDAGVLFQVGLYYKYAGKRDQAAATLRRVLDLEPDNLMARIELEFVEGQCAAGSGEAISRLRALDASLPAANPAHWVILSRMADMALARGDYAQARDYAARSRGIVRQVWSSITLAAADAELGRADEARQVGGEHRTQWPALDFTRFADGALTRWCLGGESAHARDAFSKLGGED